MISNLYFVYRKPRISFSDRGSPNGPSICKIIYKWIWSGAEIIQVGENQRPRRITNPTATLSNTNPTWADLGTNTGLRKYQYTVFSNWIQLCIYFNESDVCNCVRTVKELLVSSSKAQHILREILLSFQITILWHFILAIYYCYINFYILMCYYSNQYPKKVRISHLYHFTCLFYVY